MIRYFRYMLSVLLMCALASCQEKEQDGGAGGSVSSPVFPEKVLNDKVAPGEELELIFTPNMDWTLSVPEECAVDFKLIDDRGRMRTEISGKASAEPVTVRIWVSPLETFDRNRSCVVTMMMGGKSQIVAEYVIPAKKKTVSVYAAKVQDGVLVKDAAGEYVYEETETDHIDVIWSAEDAEFVIPVKIIANCQWDIDRNSFPAWLELGVPEKTEGIVKIPLKGVSLNEEHGEITFVSSGEELETVTVNLPSCRGLDVFSANSQYGEWVYAEEGGYEYTAEPQTDLTLVWTGSDFRLPVKIDARCEWTLTGLPEWLTYNIEGRRSGVVEFNLLGVPSKYPLDDQTAKLSFGFGGEVIKEMNVTIPGCRENISFSLGYSLYELDFNYSGQYRTTAEYMDAPVKGYVTAPASTVIFAVEMIDGQCAGKNPEWLKYDLSVDQDTDTGVVLQTRSLEISVSENDGTQAREAYIFLLSSDVEDVAVLFEEDGSTVKEEYIINAIPVIQACVPVDYLTPVSSPDRMAAAGATLIRTEKEELYTMFGATRYAYELTYINTWSSDEAYMDLTYPYHTIEIYDDQKQLVASENREKFWLKFNPAGEQNTYGAVTMFLHMYEYDENGDIVTDENGKIKEIVPVESVGYVVFRAEPEAGETAGETLCVVECRFEPVIVPDAGGDDGGEGGEGDGEGGDGEGGGEGDGGDGEGGDDEPKPDVYEDASHLFTNQYEAYSANASLVKYTSGYTYDLWKENECPIYKLTYRSEDTVLEINMVDILKGKVQNFSVNPYAKSDFVIVNGKSMYEDGGQLLTWNPNTNTYRGTYNGKPKIKMQRVDDTLEKDEVAVLFYSVPESGDMSSGQRVVLVLLCELDLSAKQ